MLLKRRQPTSFFQRPRFEVVDAQFIGKYEIPSGFITDGLSLPWFIRGVYSPLGHGFRAAVLHDFLLSEGKLPRKECAQEFRDQLKRDGVGYTTRTIFYVAVRLWDLKNGRCKGS